MRSQLIKATPKGTLTLDIERGVMVKREIRYDETVLNAIGANSVVLKDVPAGAVAVGAPARLILRHAGKE